MAIKQFVRTKWGKIIIGATLFSLIMVTVMAYSLTKVQEKVEQQQRQQSNAVFQNIGQSIQDNDEKVALMVSYVKKHAPYHTTAADQEMFEKLVHDIVHEQLFEQEHIAQTDESEVIEVDELVYMAWQFQEALLKQDIDLLIGVFSLQAYAEYLYQFESPVEMEQALHRLLQTVSRQGKFVGLSFERVENKHNQVQFTLYYNDDEKRYLTLGTTMVEDVHHHSEDDARGEVEMFSTKFDEILKNFKD